MKKHYFTTKKNHSLFTMAMILFILLGYNAPAFGQIIKPFQQRTSQATPSKKVYNVKGDFVLFGNTNLTLQSYGDNTNNSNNKMKYVDVDGDNSTINSSTSELKLSTENGAEPTCSNIIYAGLYWTGRAHDVDAVNNSPMTFTVGGKSLDKRKVKVKGPNSSSYTEFTANANDIYFPGQNHDAMYTAYAEVTNYVIQNGIGNYTIADMALREGNGGSVGYYGGWAMVVVYENSKMTRRDVTIFDGHAYLSGNQGNGSYELPVSGFNAVQQGPVNVKLGLIAGEGDRGIPGDYFDMINQNNQWVRLNHAGNSTGNFFNSSIFTGGNTRNPSLLNNTGLDISMFDLPNANKNLITNGQTSTKFRYGTTGDTYIIPFIALAIDAYIPEPEAIDQVVTINGQTAGPSPTIEPGQEVEVTVEIRNRGDEAIDNAVATVPIPFGSEFVSASGQYFEGLSGPQPYFDQNVGANGSIVWNLGTLPVINGSPKLATLTYKLKATTDCQILSNDSCALNIPITGVMSGEGAISGVLFENYSFIQGHTAVGNCEGEPIVAPISIEIDKDAYVQANCAGVDPVQVFTFCNVEGSNIPFTDFSGFFPTGSRFYNEYPVTNSSVEYTISSGFPTTPGETTYYAIPPSSETCVFKFKIDITEITSVPEADNVDYCVGETSAPLEATVSEPGLELYFYTVETGGTAQTSFLPDTSTAGTFTYYVAEGASAQCIGPRIPITVTVIDLPVAPELSETLKTYCEAPTTGIALNSFVTSTPPTGAELHWTTNPDLSVTADYLPNNPMVTAPGVWYAFYSTTTGNCLSTAKELTLEISDLELNENPLIENVTCFEGNDGSIDISVTGGTGNYTYAWSTNDGSGLDLTAEDQTGLTAGTYAVIIDDGKCAIEMSYEITEPDALEISFIDIFPATTAQSCSDGSATAVPSGGVAPYAYLWSDGQTTAIATGLAEGNHIVKVTDANGCEQEVDVNITCDNDCDAVVSLAGAITDVLCYGEATGAATVSASSIAHPASTFTFTWNTVPAQVDAGVSSSTISGQPAGTYTVSVTIDGTVCEAVTYEVTIAEPDALEVSFIDIFPATTAQSCSDGSATAVPSGGVAPYAYLWSDGQTTAIATGLAEGNHIVKVTDANGCEQEVDVNITCDNDCDAVVSLAGAITDVLCYGEATGAATVSASSIAHPASTFTFTWNTVPAQVDAGVSSSTISGQPAGTYTVSVTIDGTVCEAVTYEVTIAEPDALEVSFIDIFPATTAQSCSDGSATAVPSGGVAPYAYLWSDGQTTAIATGLAEGNHIVKVTDANGCEQEVDVNITCDNDCDAVVSLAGAITDVLCYGEATGAATVSASSIAHPASTFTFTWNTVPAQVDAGVSSSTISGQPAGTYTVSVTIDGTVCEAVTYEVTIAEPDALEVSFIDIFPATTAQSCSDGSATAVPSGGVAPYAYLWSDGQTTAIATGLAEGNHIVKVTDANGCEQEVDVNITCDNDCDAVVSLAGAITDVLCYGEATGAATVSASSIAHPASTFTFTWNTVPAQVDAGVSSSTISGQPAGTYTVSVTIDGTLCAAETFEVTIAEPTGALIGTLSKEDPTSSQNCADGTATVVASGGTAPYTYLWSNGANTASISGLEAGTYSVTVTDANGCTFITDEITLTCDNDCDAVVSLAGAITDVLCYGEATGAATVSASSIAHPASTFTFTWNTVPAQVDAGVSSSTISGQPAGTYTVSVTIDGTVCEAVTYEVTVAEPLEALSIEITDIVPATTAQGCTDGSATVVASGGTAPYEYLWSDGQTTATATDLTEGIHTVLVTDANGCEQEVEVEITCDIPSIALIKTSNVEVDPTTGCSTLAVDDIITYSFSVRNPGNVTLTDIIVSDLVGGVTVAGGPITLTPGAEDTTTFTATYTITQADIDNGTFTNSAEVVGTPPRGPNVTDTSNNEGYVGDNPTVVTICTDASIALIKTANVEVDPSTGCSEIAVNDVITYSFSVKNTGNSTLTNVVVADPDAIMSGGPIASLAPGAEDTATFTATYTITQADLDAGMFSNQATATGTAPDDSQTTDISDHSSYTDNNPTIVDICTDASIALIKTANVEVDPSTGCSEIAVNDVITYSFSVKNTGNSTLTNVVVADPDAIMSGGPIASLAPGAEDTATFTATYTITQADLDAGMFSNQATATGTAPDASQTTDISDHSDYTGNNPTIVDICTDASIALIKTANVEVDPTTGCTDVEVGTVIAYSFSVKNTGNATLTDVVVTDPDATMSGGPIASLAPGVEDTSTFTATYTITQADLDAGMFSNQATATGTAPDASQATDISDHSDYTDNNPTIVDICTDASIALIKTANVEVDPSTGCSEIAVDDVITYSFSVKNTGNSTLTNVVVTDPDAIMSGGPIASLAPGAEDTATFTATYTITQADLDAGMFSNQATATGTAPDDSQTTDVSDHSSYTDNNPTIVDICTDASIVLIKTANVEVDPSTGCSEIAVDDVITYNFSVMNTGNVTLTDVMVSDLIGGVTVTGAPISLAPGAEDTTTFTATYTITQADIDNGSFANTAEVVGTTPSATEVTDTSDNSSYAGDNPTVVIICTDASIALIKTSNVEIDPSTGCSEIAVDDVITYNFSVMNTGNVTLTDVMVSDLIGGVTVTGDPINLAPGAEDTTTFTATYTITQADIDNGSFSNTAEVVGTTPSATEVTDTSDNSSYAGNNPTVVIICTNASIALIKESNVEVDPSTGCSEVAVDDVITYNFSVMNTGNVTLTDVMVSDLIGGVTVTGGPLASLAPGAEDFTTFTATYTITQADIDNGSFSNTAEVVGTTPIATEVTDTSDNSSYAGDNPTVVTICSDPAIAIVKTGVFNDENGDDCSNVDETITYTFTVTNEGNVTLSDIVVDDPLLGGPLAGPVSGDTDGDGKLDVTETWIYTATYTITQDDIDAGEVVNQATATGTAPDLSEVSDLSGTDIGNDNTTVIELCQNPVIAIVKTGIFNDENGDDCSNVDETITYTFTVTNEGNVSLSNIVVDDPLLGGPLAGPVSGDTDGDGKLDVTETWIYTATYTITQDDIDAGEVVNQATATGTAPDLSEVSDLSGTDIGNDNTTVIELCQNPVIAIVKTGIFNDENGDDCSNVDETITYTFTVTNEGNVSLSNIVVDDPLLGGPLAGPVSGDTDGDGKLDVTETWIYTATYTITQDDIDAGEVVNQATATGTAPDLSEVSDLSGTDIGNDNTTVIELCQNPVIAIVKTGIFNDENGDDCSNVDETITYTFTVTNEGNVSLSNIVVDDPLLGGPLAGPVSGDTDGDGKLDVTETWIYTATYTITQDDIDAGEVVNQATATGTAPDLSEVSDLSGTDIGNDNTTVIELCQNPVIAIVKTGIFNDENGDDCSNVDETITYTFTVTNEGNVSLSNIVVDDPLLGGPLAGPVSGDTDGDGKLDVTETWIYTATYTITQDDIDAGEVVNQATATGTAPDLSEVSDLSGTDIGNDNTTVIELCQNPVIAIVKTGIFNDENGDDCSNVDETITYTFTVTNEGNVSLSNIVVDDPLLGGPLAGPVSGDTDGDGKLDVTETWIYTATYTITQDDIDAGEVVNQATATGTAPDLSEVSDLSGTDIGNDEPTVIELCQNPVIALIKIGEVIDTNGNGCADVGETIDYSFTVFNLGNVTLSNIMITDPLVSVSGGPITLAPGETDSTMFTATYTITQDDIDAGFVENQATVTGTDNSGTTVSDLSDDDSEFEDDPTVTVLCQDPAIALIKAGVPVDENDNGCADIGETILYTFSVKNTGNVALTNVIVTDPMVTVVGGPINLAAGEEDLTTFTAIYTVTQTDVDTGFIENQATAEGTASNGDMVSDQSDDNSYLEDDPTVTVLCQNPSISLEKIGEFNDENGNGASEVGETITYTFAVTNTGDVTLYNITLEDLLPGVEISGGPIAVLLPGETDSTTFTATYAITQEDIDAGEVVNHAIVSGEDIGGSIVEADAEAVVVLPDVLGTDFEIFNGITPNGDGMNDYFWVKGIHNYPNNNVKIFNRWGVLVYETDGYGRGEDDSQNTFTGISEGRVTVQKDKELPTGTYFYILTFQGENPGKDSYTGYLYINK
ncbi:MAG: DUF7507 domain-containing protein [Aequorivita sp.]